MQKLFVLSAFLMLFFLAQAEKQGSNTYPVSQQDTAKQREAKEAAERKAEEEKKAQKEEKAAKTSDSREAAYHDAVVVIETSVSGYSSETIQPSDQMKVELDKKVEKLKAFSDIKITVTGHTCDRGSEETNKKIAGQRADAIKAYLVAAGIKENRIKTDSKGKDEPIEPNTNDTNRKSNRRVEFKVN